MLRPPILKFTDDIPNAQFWSAFDAMSAPLGDFKGQMLVNVKTFRVPAEFGWGWAYARCRGELLMSAPILQPARPIEIMTWLKSHPKEAAFRVR